MSAGVRNSIELDLMRKSGLITAKALRSTVLSIKDGVNLLELDKIAEKTILKLGGKPSFKTVSGYQWTSCLTVNHQVVHGIPKDIVIKDGDLVSVDLGAVYQGWHTDAAWSVIAGSSKLGTRRWKEKEKFLKTGEKALWEGIRQAKANNKIGDISSGIQKKVEGRGYSVVRSLVGHGVGKSLHEEPEVPGFGVVGTGLTIYAGMTLAIEVIYTSGKPDVFMESDGWTISTQDGSLAGLFEMSVIVREKRAEVLTDWRKI